MNSLFKVVLFTCLIGIAFAHKKVVCQHEPGETLIASQPLLQVSLLDKPKFYKSFEGYRITCVETNLPLGLAKLISISILEGGVGCNFVGLQINVGKLLSVGIGIKIYGVEASEDEVNNQNCQSYHAASGGGGLLGLGLI